MDNFSEVVKIIEAGMSGDRDKVIAYSKLLMSKLDDDRHKKMIQDRLDGSYKNHPKIVAKDGILRPSHIELYTESKKELDEIRAGCPTIPDNITDGCTIPLDGVCECKDELFVVTEMNFAKVCPFCFKSKGGENDG